MTKQISVNLITLILFFFLASCSFNSVFFKPDKYPAGFNELKIKTPDDTIRIFFVGEAHQPVFTKRNGRDTVIPPYTIESVVFKSSNGHIINGWFLKPKEQTTNITLLHLHGNAGSLFSQYQLISPLVKKGLQVFMFDYSGYGFSEGKATHKNVLEDANSALDYLKSREEAAGTKVVVYGQSLGGHLSAVLATQRQKDIDGLVTEGAFSSPKDIGALTAPVIGRLFTKERYAAKKSIKDYHKPLLVIHSREDKIIPFSMGQRIFSAANTPKEFYEIKKSHMYGPTYYAEEITIKIKEMLR